MAKPAVILSLRSENLEECAAEVALSLKKGNLCIIPTDTIYGLVALERLPAAVERIYEIKKRPKDKPLIRLIGRVESLREFTDQALPPSLAAYWPGPLTIVFRGRGGRPGGESGVSFADPGGGLAGGEVGRRVAVRLPEDPFLKGLFKELGYSSLVAPSANISGEEDIFDCSALAGIFSSEVDIIVCREEWSGGKKPSTILDVSGEPWKILREGAVKIDPAVLR
jgi:L-threonylcarbamoyladenylate synthase